jgi:hypothetical protein
MKTDLGAKIPEATMLYNESKHNTLALVGKANEKEEEEEEERENA